MSVTLIVGKPGAGKSYSAVHLCILPAIKSRRPVYTNVPLRVESLKEEIDGAKDIDITCVPPDELDVDDLHKLPGGTLIVLDELWRYFPAKEKTPAPEHEAFFAEHRHRVGRVPGIDGLVSQDIVILTQGTTDIPLWIRSRVAATFIVTKLDAVGADKRFRVDRYTGSVSSERPPKTKLVSSAYGTYTSDVWRYYLSHTKSDDTGGVDLSTVEAGATRAKTIWTSPTMLGLFGMLGFVALFMFWRFGISDRPFLGVEKKDPEVFVAAEWTYKPEIADAVPVPKVVAAPDPAPVPAPPPEAPAPDQRWSGWWINGRATFGAENLVTVTDGTRVSRLRLRTDACTTVPTLRCTVEGEELTDIATPPNKSLLPSQLANIPGAMTAQR